MCFQLAIELLHLQQTYQAKRSQIDVTWCSREKHTAMCTASKFTTVCAKTIWAPKTQFVINPLTLMQYRQPFEKTLGWYCGITQQQRGRGLLRLVPNWCPQSQTEKKQQMGALLSRTLQIHSISMSDQTWDCIYKHLIPFVYDNHRLVNNLTIIKDLHCNSNNICQGRTTLQAHRSSSTPGSEAIQRMLRISCDSCSCDLPLLNVLPISGGQTWTVTVGCQHLPSGKSWLRW